MPLLPSLPDTIARYGLAAKKSLGQHFLLNEAITARIAQAAGDLPEVNVIEIGPGPGGLTRALLAAGARAVYAVEKDARCVAALAELQAAYPGKLHIIEGDALEVDLPAHVPPPRKIVANLPYNAGTAMLLKWLEEMAGKRPEAGGGSDAPSPLPPSLYASLTLMFQREVAERIAAAPGGGDYGRLSVFAQWLCDVQPGFVLPPGAFSPPPKVHSAVITLTPRPAPLFAARKEVLERVLAAAFGQRRKMLRQSLKSVHPRPEELLAAAGIDGTRRAETLSVEAFCRLANSLETNG